eukprot:g26517.t1
MNLSKCVCGVLLASLAGCQSIYAPSMASLNIPKFDFDRWEFRANNSDDDLESSVSTKLIGDHTTVAGLNVVTLQGVGLVVGLNGTGGDPPPSVYRSELLKEMRRRKVNRPNEILRSPNTALVVVRAYLPPLVQKKDRFDVEVRIPGNSDATSLDGGYLMECLLSEQAIIPGRGVLSGHITAKAAGPILISATQGSNEKLAGVVRRGNVLGGGFSLQERDMALYLRNDFKSIRNAKRIADKIGRRFFQYNKSGIRVPLATAKTDQRVVLKIQDKYRDNFPRYLQVIRSIPFRETKVAQRVRMQKLKQDLNNPPKAEIAALRLEAIGQDSVVILKEALQNKSLEVRFHAAVALAYLGDASGLPTLAEAARTEPAFRVFAFAAMAAIEDAETNLLLRELANETSAETRYGAIRALTTLDKHDPFIRGEELNGQFRLRALNTSGPAMVHLTRHRMAEIVLFGANQRFSTPLALRAGRDILITASPQSEHVIITKYNENKRKVVSSRIADVIRTVAEFGASYPDVAGMLTQAHQRKHLPGTLEIDALPEAGLGFKSFADRTQFEFAAGITGVVGPNGSGKSNVVDGIKWILGDQSAKSLRGKEMTDVIFNGALNRKAASLAEATITFDNSNGFLPLETQEVQVGRRLWRSGDSEYLINRETARLKDVRQLFMGTGAGSAAYSIIEQGRVDQILQANPASRRAIFEEAAGISLFKTRRAEFLRRMERVEQLLVRLTDIVDELEAQRNSLRNQAEKAAMFREISEELRTLWQGLAADDYRHLSARLTELEQGIASLAAEIDDRQEQRQQLDEQMGRLDAEIGDVDNQIRTIQRKSSSIREAIAGHLATIELQTNRGRELDADVTRLMNQQSLMAVRSREGQSELAHNRQVLGECEVEFQRLQSKLSAHDSEIEQLTAKITSAREELSSSRSQAKDHSQAIEQLQQQLLSLQTQRQASEAAKAAAEKRRSQFDAKIEATLGELQVEQQQLQEAESVVAGIDAELTEARSKRESLLTEQSQFRDLLAELREDRSAAQARQSVLEDFESRQEGLGIGVREILRRATTSHYSPWNQILGSVAELIDVELEDAALLEAALGARSQLIVIREFAAIVDYLNTNAAAISGRVGFVECRSEDSTTTETDGADAEAESAESATTDAADSRLHVFDKKKDVTDLAGQPGVIRRADELVKQSESLPELAERILADTWVVETLDVAMSLAESKPAAEHGLRFVTLQGEVLEADGTLIVGTPRSESALVSRKSELRKLKTDLTKLDRRIADEERRLAEASAELTEIDAEIEKITHRHETATEQQSERRARYSERSRERERLEQEYAALSDEIQGLADVENEYSREFTNRESELVQLRDELRASESAVEAAEQKITESDTRLQSLRESRNAEGVDLAKQQERLKGLQDSCERLERDQTQRMQQRREAERRFIAMRKKRDQVELTLLNTRSTVAERFLADEQLLSEVDILLADKDRLRGRRAELRHEETALREEDRLAKEQQHEQQIALQEIRHRIESLAERIAEEYQTDLTEIADSGVSAFQDYLDAERGSDTAAEESEDETGSAASGGTPEICFEDVRDEIEARVNRLRRKRKMMGNVDTDSLQNLDELETRYTRLSTTLNDLLEAKKHLEDLVRKIDARCKELFVTTFDAIRSNFQVLFRKAFGGGDGDIVLEDSEDILECGIDIVARPPGKELKSITLMSGGEKTLTAFALLLAIFKCRPSPYCVLDEVDAALDEANVERLLALLEEFKQDTQFVIITHKKPTMAIADQIYGVTMEQSGVSKRMTVRFENISENGEFNTDDNMSTAA